MLGDMMGCRAWGCGFCVERVTGAARNPPTRQPRFFAIVGSEAAWLPHPPLVPQAGAAVCTLRLRPFPLAVSPRRFSLILSGHAYIAEAWAMKEAARATGIILLTWALVLGMAYIAIWAGDGF